MTEDEGRERGVLFSASEEYFLAAKKELLDLYDDGRVTRVGPDLGRLTGPSLAQVAEDCRNRPLVFVKHLTAEAGQLTPSEAGDLDLVAASVRKVTAGLRGGLAVQVWVSGRNPLAHGVGDLVRASTAVLNEDGLEVGRAGYPQTLSLCVTEAGLTLGLATAEEQLSDWPGGRVRLAKKPEQISRAEFKLEEAFAAFGIELPADGNAVDLGASPGGWTRILREHGLAVWAVDPGDLDDRLLRDRGVHHVRATAGEFFARERRRFDLVVNDMKMDPELSCRIVVDAAERLRPGAPAVVTLKLSRHRPVDVVRRCFGVLGARYRIRAARQLHHNRHEVTVVAERR